MSDEAMLDKLALRPPAAAFFLFGTGLDWYLLKRGTTIQVYAEHVDYYTTTKILETTPDGDGGLALTLDATIDNGELVVTEAMIAGAEYAGECWYIRHGGLVFRFDARQAERGFGPERLTQDPEAREQAPRRHVEKLVGAPDLAARSSEDRWLGF